ncbi:MAG: magnesium-translocating P-type ATPase [Burkholderiaceae bacterium]|nr:magnesium-translocating P-type ATPase [Burkholderiaceae bacterium]
MSSAPSASRDARAGESDPPVDAWWSRDAGDLMRSLGASAGGLPQAEAERRLRVHGANTVEDVPGLTAVRLLIRQVANPLVLILVFGALVSMLVRSWVDASIVVAIVVGSAALGFLQEYRASAAVAELRQRLALTVRVLRDGALRSAPASAIVPGDVVELSAGNLVPADGIVIRARDFLVTEASLTGEPFPVEKQPGTVPADSPVGARTNCVHLGTSVRSGTATVLVVETGRRTLFGEVAASLRARAPETEFERGIRRFGNLLVRVMLVMVAFVLVVNQALDRPVIESLLFATALAVGLSPELLPAIVSVTLSHGARAMAQRGVIVRRLQAIENLGSIDTLCTDKTGTLTQGVIQLDAATDAQGRPSEAVRRMAWLNAAFETGIENPLDAALIAAGDAAGLSVAGERKIDEIPYDFIRKRLTIAIEETAGAGTHLMITKGAFDNVLAACTRVAADAGGAADAEDEALDAAARERLEAWYRARGSEGFRVLAVATRRVPASPRHSREDEQSMTLAGFLLFLDPPKPGAAQAIADLQARGIRVRMITGDNRYVAAHVAGAIGLDASALMTGAEIAGLNDESLWYRAARADLFAEVDPQQKERIVRALQRTGHAVGYLGDGINDAPSLHVADVGISVEGAVDVARESADVVMLRPDLDVLRRGVEEGRRTFANTMKYINITTSANFGNMVSMALATPLLPFLPLAAKQILLNNFLSDIPSAAVSTDNVDPEHVERAQRWNVRDVRRFMVVFGLASSAFDLLAFAVLLLVFRAGQATFQTAWFVISLLTELAVVLVLRTARPALKSRPGRLLGISTVVVMIAALCIPYLGPAASVFGFVPMPPALLAASLAIVVGYVVFTEILKLWTQRRRARAAGSPR